MLIRKFLFCSLLAGVLVPAAAAGATVVAESTFNRRAEGLDGWTLSNGVARLKWIPDGGETGGYAQDSEPRKNHELSSLMIAPAKFLGDHSDLDEVGRLVFYHRFVEVTAAFVPRPLFVRIHGPEKCSAFWNKKMPASQGWVKVEVPFSVTEWTIEGPDYCTWPYILHDITGLAIRIERANNRGVYGHDVEGLDEIRLLKTKRR